LRCSGEHVGGKRGGSERGGSECGGGNCPLMKWKKKIENLYSNPTRDEFTLS
jgi:hypothetical protein